MTSCESWNAKIAVGVVWTRLLIKCLLFSDCWWGEWFWFRMWFWFRLIPYCFRVNITFTSPFITHTRSLTPHTHTQSHTNEPTTFYHTIPHTLKWWPRRDSQDGQAFNMYFMYITSCLITDMYLQFFLYNFLSNVHAYFNYRPSEVNTASVLRGDYCSDLHIHYMHSLNCSKIVDHSPHALCMP